MNTEQHIEQLRDAAKYLRARAALAIPNAIAWPGQDYERDAMLESATQKFRDADTLDGRANILEMTGELDFEPIVEESVE